MFSSSLLFLDIGGGELMLILFVALMLFGGKKLPELARGLGKGIRDFKDASEGVKREINSQIDNFEAKKAEESAKNSAVAAEIINEPLVEAPADPTIPAAETTGTTTEIVSPVANTVPVGTIPLKNETNKATETVHAKETPIEGVNTAHEEYKS